MLFLLAGLSAVTAFSWHDRARSHHSETISRDTAFGDLIYYDHRSASEAPGVPALLWQGQPLFASHSAKLKIDDGEMQRIGSDPDSGLNIYRLRHTPGGQLYVNTPGGQLYVKIDLGEFLPLAPEPQP